MQRSIFDWDTHGEDGLRRWLRPIAGQAIKLLDPEVRNRIRYLVERTNDVGGG